MDASVSIPSRTPAYAWDRTTHWLWLLLSLAVLLAAGSLRVDADQQRVLVPGAKLALPGTCTYKVWFGVDCPGCGMTRCFVSLAHGDLVAAWRFHPVGILAFAMVAAQIPYRCVQLWRLRQGRVPFDGTRWGVLLLFTLALLLLAQWSARTGWKFFWGP